MFAALLTALFFGITPVCANRAIRLAGFAAANLGRLLAAAAVLGVWAFAFGQGLRGPFAWFFAAGAVGFGLGGACMFLALPRLGAPLASLIVEAVAAVGAMAMAWAWYADAVDPARLGWAALVLAGLGVGLFPYIRGTGRRPGALPGALLALLAGLGQAVSLVVSRKAFLSLKLAGLPMDPLTAAFQRLCGGVLVALVLWLAFRRLAAPGVQPPAPRRGPGDRPLFWIGLNALFGPILGVTCLLWALKTMQPGLAQTIAATAPLVSVPFARWLEGHTPPRLYYAGCAVVIAGLAGISLAGGS